MVFTMLRDIAKNINDNVFFSIMDDKAKYVQLRWVENNFEAHEDLIGIHTVENIKSDTLVTVLKYILIRLNIIFSNYCSQCYDEAEPTGINRGVTTKIQSE